MASPRIWATRGESAKRAWTTASSWSWRSISASRRSKPDPVSKFLIPISLPASPTAHSAPATSTAGSRRSWPVSSPPSTQVTVRLPPAMRCSMTKGSAVSRRCRSRNRTRSFTPFGVFAIFGLVGAVGMGLSNASQTQPPCRRRTIRRSDPTRWMPFSSD